MTSVILGGSDTVRLPSSAIDSLKGHRCSVMAISRLFTNRVLEAMNGSRAPPSA